jgi:sulfur relay (sulfurtransferase) complex TusBCD TusD component (DsrE family)
MMDKSTVLLYSRNGLGEAPNELQQVVVAKFLFLLRKSGQYPGAILFYTDGVKLVCEGSPILEHLGHLENSGVRLVVCSTCLDYFGLMDSVKVGEILGMPDILAVMQTASNVISL